MTLKFGVEIKMKHFYLRTTKSMLQIKDIQSTKIQAERKIPRLALCFILFFFFFYI